MKLCVQPTSRLYEHVMNIRKLFYDYLCLVVTSGKRLLCVISCNFGLRSDAPAQLYGHIRLDRVDVKHLVTNFRIVRSDDMFIAYNLFVMLPTIMFGHMYYG